MKSALGRTFVSGLITSIRALARELAVALSTRSDTVNVPVDCHAFSTFAPEPKVPSPKSHVHAVGLPVERSVKVTIWPTLTTLDENVKSAASVSATVSGSIPALVPEPPTPEPRSALEPVPPVPVRVDVLPSPPLSPDPALWVDPPLDDELPVGKASPVVPVRGPPPVPLA